MTLSLILLILALCAFGYSAFVERSVVAGGLFLVTLAAVVGGVSVV